MKRLTIYTVSTLGVFLIGIGIDIACGPEADPYDYYTSFFHANLPKTDAYWSFYYNGWTFLNDDTEQVSEADINSREWAEYLKAGVKTKDVKHAMYELPYRTDSLLLAQNRYITGKLPDSLQHNTFLKVLLTPRKTNALKYYHFSKSVQQFTAHNYDRSWEPYPKDTTLMKKRAQEAFTMAGTEQDQFLKLRYYYQSQRLFHYSGFIKEAAGVYDKYITKFRSDSHVMGWALSLKAGEEFRLHHRETAAYLFSKVFAQYPERRISAYYSFNWTGAPLEQVIRQAKTPAEKGFIYGITGFRDAHIGLSHLSKVYQADAHSALISVLLLREINKIEEGYLNAQLTGSNEYGPAGYYEHRQQDSARRAYVNYIPKLKSFCDKLATDNKYPEPALGHLSSAYLSWIQKDSVAGFKSLAATDGMKLRPKLYDEKQMISLLLYSQTIKSIDTATESKLLPALAWLEGKVRQERTLKKDTDKYWGDYALKYYSASSRDFYARILAPAYLKQKDTAMAALCILRSEKTVKRKYSTAYSLGFDMPSFWQNEMHSWHFNKILRWQADGAKRPYLRLLMDNMSRQYVTNTYDLLGTAYLREHKYAQAARALKHINEKALNQVSLVGMNAHEFPVAFAGRLNDYPRASTSKKVEGYNRLQYALSMAALQKQIAAGKPAAATYYKMANGLYNVTYNGNAWFYTAYSRASDDNTRTNGFYYDNDYLHARKAEAYFLMARKLSNDAEFKARCTFMAAKCRQKRAVFPLYPDWIDNETQYNLAFKKYEARVDAYNLGLRQNSYFPDLKANYSKTKFYKTAISECSYFRDFLIGSKPKPQK